VADDAPSPECFEQEMLLISKGAFSGASATSWTDRPQISNRADTRIMDILNVMAITWIIYEIA
jgi:hypothetical protein